MRHHRPTLPRRFATRPGRRGLALAAALVALTLLASCGDPPPPGASWPDGTLVIARREAVVELAAALQAWPDSKLARFARDLTRDLPDCAWLQTLRPVGTAAGATSIACHPGDGSLAELAALRGDADWVFALPKRDDGRVIGSGRLAADGTLDWNVRVPSSAVEGGAALLLPTEVDPGPSLLSHAEELLHARVRPEGGLNVAALVPDGGQGDRMFRLKSELFAGAVLDGTWELAVYLPEPGRAMPDAALAVGFSLRAPAVAAMEEFIAALRDTWPVQRTPHRFGAARGACLRELNLLPDLAPCYVATNAALVVGWNAASLARALGDDRRPAAAGAGPHPAGGWHVNLGRFPEADARFAALTGSDAAPDATQPLPWKRLSARGRVEADGVRLHIQLAKPNPGDGA